MLLMSPSISPSIPCRVALALCAMSLINEPMEVAVGVLPEEVVVVGIS